MDFIRSNERDKTASIKVKLKEAIELLQSN